MRNKIGRWHKWWLKQFIKSYKDGLKAQSRGENRGLGICVYGYEGTIQGRALIGLLNRGLISYNLALKADCLFLQLQKKEWRMTKFYDMTKESDPRSENSICQNFQEGICHGMLNPVRCWLSNPCQGICPQIPAQRDNIIKRRER